MANVKISELPVASSVGATDSFPLVQGGTTKQATKAVLLDDLGTPSSVTLTNATGLPLTTGVTGTLPTGNGGTGLTSFTANGVVYASSGSALATGSALTFDGTNFATTGTATATKLVPTGNVTAGNGMYLPATNELAWSVNSTEQMRLTSTGLGIGTSSPGAKLGVGGNAIFSGGVGGSPFIAFSQDQAGGTPAYWQWSSSTGLSTFYTTNASSSNGSFKWMTGGSDKMFLDSSGNLGLGVTPSVWSSGLPPVFQTAYGNINGSGTTQININQNAYLAGAGWTYLTNGAATMSRQDAGSFVWFTAPSGTAGNAISFSQVMTLDASGNLLVGTTSASIGASGRGVIEVNGTSDSVFASKVNGTLAAVSGLASSTEVIYGAVTNVPVLFRTNNTERARITSGGNFKIGGTADRATTEGDKQLVLFDGTAPVGTLANGVSFYSASGEANVMDAAGNATLLSPHDAETNEWIFRSKHTPTGKVLKIDVERLLKFVNDHFGLDAVHEFIEP